MPQSTPPLPSVRPLTLKLVLEQLGYEVTASNPFCWVMRRSGCISLQIPRLGRSVGLDALHSTLKKARIGPEQFFRMCQLVTGPSGSD